jgi:signal transduction histidine kinase
VQPDWIQPPYSVTDLIAVLLWVLAVLYAHLQRRDHEPGAGWFAAAMALLALYIGNNERHLPIEPVSIPSGTVVWLGALLAGIACLGIGLSHYVGLHGRSQRVVIAAIVAPLLLCALALVGVALLQWPVRRHTFNLVLGASFVVQAAIALWGWRHERSAGHGYVAISFLLVPALAVVNALQQTPTAHLRYWGALPILAIGLTLLTVSLLRRRRMLLDEVARRAAAERSLAEINASLEAQVDARTRELRDMVAGLESFNRQVSHDLRGPLGGIGGLVQLASDALQRGDIAAAQRLLAPVGPQVASSSKLVDSLLLLARSADAALHKAPVDLARLTHDVAGALQPAKVAAARVPAVQIDALPVVQADETLLRAVMTNLIGNALKFTTGRSDGRVRIGAQVEPGRVTVTVSDNGVGFEPSAAQTLFEPFARLHGAKFEGTGIGLTIVRRIVERHGGRVWASGEPGVGASFSFTLPA